MTRAGLAFLAGVLLFHQLPVWPSVWLVFGVLALALLVSRIKGLWPLSVAALAVTWTWWHAAAVIEGRLPEALAGREMVVEGVVVDLPAVKGGRTRFAFEVERLVGAPDADPASDWTGKVRLSWSVPAQEVRVGQRWRLNVRLYSPNGMANPGGFDYERWLFTRGFTATGYVLDRPTNHLWKHNDAGLPVQRLRSAIRDRLTAVEGSHEARALLLALTIGDRSGFDERQWALFRATGTSHLVAISGLHLGLVAGLVWWLTQRLWRLSARLCNRWPAPDAATLAALVAATGYAALAGFSLPTQRALAMLAVGAAALWLRIGVRPGPVLGGALLAVLLVDPMAPLDAGFWLSFGAVGIILLVMSGRLGQTRISGWWRVQWGIGLGLMPVLAGWSMPVSLSAPLINLVAVPWFTLVIVPLSLAGVGLLGWADGPASALLTLDLWLLEQTGAALEAMAWDRRALWSPGSRSPAVLALACVGVTVLLMPLGGRHRLLGAVMLLPLALPGHGGVEEGGLRVSVLDVGQGLSVVVQTAGHVLVYDLGPRYPSGFNTAEAVVAPFLRWAAADRVDVLVLSHDDADHAGAWRPFGEAVEVGRVLAGQPDRLDVAAQACARGQGWTWDGVRFEVLMPIGDDRLPGDNDASCVLRIVHPAASVLLTGDITRRGESRLAAAGDDLRSDIVVVPHHGSRSSSSPMLIDATAARYAVVSAGFRNRYGLPHPEVVARWRDHGTRVLGTADSGAIRFEVAPDGEWDIAHYRLDEARFWRRPRAAE